MDSQEMKTHDILPSAVRLLSAAILLGYFTFWILLPTKIFSHLLFLPIRDMVNPAYFASEGASFLLFCFPLIFVSVLGCLYLHLVNRSNHTKLGRKDLLAKWKKPMLVKGPLGIVSMIEIAFLIMFLALLIWCLSHDIHNFFTERAPQLAATRGEKLWEAKLERASYAIGLVGNMGVVFLFFPVARGSTVLPLLGLTSESSIKYHIWLGHLTMLFFSAHGLGYITYWAVTNHISEMVKWGKAEVSNVAGEISLLAGLGLWVTTFPRIRQKMFELFFYAHHLYILFMLFFYLHLGINLSTIEALPGFYLFLIDRYLRFLQSRARVRLVSARILPCQTVELNFTKTPGLSYNPTSILFMNIPSISKLQWHPFTISSNSNLEPENLSVVIKSEGSWSKKLYHMLSSPSAIDHLQVSVEGPYGPASTHFLRHDTLVMVSGGSGITPFISIIRELIFASTLEKCKTPQVILISSFKNSSDLTMLDLILPISGTPSIISSLQLKIEAYVTREKEPTIHNSKLLQTIWFKPHKTDAHISPILGPKGSLWLGAIISSSFVIFLIIIALINRYYIYPIDHNTRRIFSHSIHSCLNMLVICVSIAMTASAAVLWNKKQYERKAKHVENIEVSSPIGSPPDKELESLPHQSLVQATNVHYGERPDLKRLLLECKGSSVGVLVCGPKKLRHDVATICSSGFTDNLHFESISFSW